MSLCPTNPIRGNHLTDNFTFDEVNKQIVPKPGTDTKAGALALNLGNAAGDTTNATDALTAAGFNAMANAVDSTAPLCGNEIQQAVTAAVAQSIACDADAQEAIACAIASNPEAVACLKAVLPSGLDLTGSALLHTFDATNNVVAAVNLSDTGVTQLATINTFNNLGGSGGALNRFQNAGKFVVPTYESGSAFGFDSATTTYSLNTGTLPGPQARWVVNHSGTAVATANIYGDNPGSFLHKLSPAGNVITSSVNINGSNSATWLKVVNEFWFADDNFNGVDLNTGVAGTVTNRPAAGGNYRIAAMSHDYTKFATAVVALSQNGPNDPTFVITITTYNLVRTGNNFEFVQTATATYNDYGFYTGIGLRQGLTWSRDNSHLISCVKTSSGTPSIHRGISQVFNVSGGTITRDLGGVLTWGTTADTWAPVVSLDGDYMLAIATETYDSGIKPSRDNVALFKRFDNKYFQIARLVGVQAMFVQGAGGARSS